YYLYSPAARAAGARCYFGNSEVNNGLKTGLELFRLQTAWCWCEFESRFKMEIRAENSTSTAVVVESSENHAAVMLGEIGP
ncbi:MAG TPA: hypothetical protein VI113_06990, partial [Alphaproteobacteria bacterium]